MDDYTHIVTGSYILNEQVVGLSGKVDERVGSLEVLLTELYDNKTYTLTGDIINTEDFTILDIIEYNENSDGPLIWYNVVNPSQSNFDGRYDGERNNICIVQPTDEEFETKSIKELVDKVLEEGLSKEGRPAILFFKRIKK